MTTTFLDLPIEPPAAEPQRFVFENADWALYDRIRETLRDQRVFVTYYKGRLEVVTVSLLHEKIAGLLVIAIRVIAEETDLPIGGAGMATMRRADLDEGVEADASFYVAHEARMRGKKSLDLSVDPPPDLAIEVEVTRRLGSRKSIYRDLGVPEIWRFGADGLTFLVKQGEEYRSVPRSPTFPQFSPEELSGFITAGISGDETA